MSQAEALLKANATEIENLKRENSAWYNEKWIWVVVGAGATAYLIKK